METVTAGERGATTSKAVGAGEHAVGDALLLLIACLVLRRE
jgi:hypothetical protein